MALVVAYGICIVASFDSCADFNAGQFQLCFRRVFLPAQILSPYNIPVRSRLVPPNTSE